MSIAGIAKSTDIAANEPSRGDQHEPGSVVGITVDSIENAAGIAQSIAAINSSLPKTTDGSTLVTTRIVLDYEQPVTEEYVKRVAAIHSVSHVMLLVADSHDLYKFKSTEEYKSRLQQCLNKLGQLVDVWEVGNEVNAVSIDPQKAQKRRQKRGK